MARILIVDDGSAVRAFAAQQLERDGHRLAHAPDAREAVAQLRASSFDLVLLDAAVPGIDGVSFARMLAESPRLLGLATLPVVMMTSSDQAGLMADSFEAGAAYVLTKPYTPRELSDVVRLVLAGSA